MPVAAWRGLLFSQADERIMYTGGVEEAGGSDTVWRLKALGTREPQP